MTSLDQIRRGLSSPAHLGRELNRLYYRRFYRQPHNPGGVSVMDEDWDTLVVLDSCRYDSFVDHNVLPGELQRRESAGSHTAEFLRANFRDGEFPDTVYITANPQLARESLDDRFHSVRHLWHEQGWDGVERTVLPETTTAAAIRALDRYPHKRLIVHYVQPRYPFVEDPDVRVRPREGSDAWGRLLGDDADCSPERVRQAYHRNLDAVLSSIEFLFASLSGRIVVTADHGAMLGERARPVPVREWGHPPGVYTEELVEVPWLVHDRSERRRIVEGEVGTASSGDEDVVERRLADLGYA